VEIGDCSVWTGTAKGGEWMCEANSKTAVMLKEVATARQTLTVHSWYAHGQGRHSLPVLKRTWL
jgi:hypothetical protein